MRHYALSVLRCVQTHDMTTKSLHEKAVKVFEGTMDSAQFIADLDAEMRSADCLHCNNQPFCRILLALMRYKRGELLAAKTLTEEAILGFRTRGIDWNEGVSHWLMGILLLEVNSRGFAERSLERALKMLTTHLGKLQVESEYGRVREECSDCITAIEAALQEARSNEHGQPAPIRQPSIRQPSPIPVETSQNTVLISEPEGGYMVLPWIPVYEGVEAGAHGPIWFETVKPELPEISYMAIKNETYTLHSLKNSDRRVTLVHDREYGWAKVHGHSMNDASPIHIDDGDYVLFYKAPHPNQNEIVIAAQPESPSAKLYSYLIKRYWNDSNELISETTMSGPQYEPVHLTKDYYIIGIVIAVAKPLNGKASSTTNNNNSMPSAGSPLSQEELRLYNKLKTRALGREDVVERLLNEARKRLPNASRLELLKVVDEEWIDDNIRYD